MALFLHPDKNPSALADKGFKRVQEAYDTLSDALRRAEYDAEMDNGGPGGEGEEAASGAAAEEEVPLAPSGVPEGPPGLKKRRARPVEKRGGRR